MAGYDCNRFVNLSPSDRAELTCSICRNIICYPVIAQCCLQTFCKDCINNWLSTNNTCPYDRKTLTMEALTRPPRIMANMLGKLQIKCDFRDKGCTEIISLEELSKHVNNCPYNSSNISLLTTTSSRDKCLLRKINELETERENILKSIQDLTNSQQLTTTNILKSCEYYSPNTDEWFFAKPMSQERRGLALVAHNGFIYAIGGNNLKVSFNTMERYDKTTQQWKPMANMIYQRIDFASASFMDKIYVCGGSGISSDVGKSCETYDPQTNQWTQI
ncbi:E3 ubiquitin-protein ligase NRDP1-like, partial [Oppia nitens]|uniref:E3 ubiquitin-protein ligase NRDP1-like n=1 Tax=Oppia nitens TaxID=1686743 RepID=UPI0023DA12DF